MSTNPYLTKALQSVDDTIASGGKFKVLPKLTPEVIAYLDAMEAKVQADREVNELNHREHYFNTYA